MEVIESGFSADGTIDSDLLSRLTSLHHQLRDEIRSRWNRSVSFQDELFGREERARFLGFGEGSTIYQDSLVLGDVSVGQHTWIGPFTILDGTGGLEIGANCSISAGVQVYTHDTVKRQVSEGAVGPERQPTRIGDWTYVGPGSIVTRGVTIGSHCVIGAMSLVMDDVEPGSLVYGVPARSAGRLGKGDAADPRLIQDDSSLKERVRFLEDRLVRLEASLRAIETGTGYTSSHNQEPR